MKNINSPCMPWGRNRNALLLKDDVGAAKPSNYSLPPQKHSYGQPTNLLNGSEYLNSFVPKKKGQQPRQQEVPIKKILYNWQSSQQQGEGPTGTERDFVRLNKTQTMYGVANAKQSTDFRKQKDFRTNSQRGKSSYNVVLPEQEFRYGKENRPSTPIKFVLGGCYALNAVGIKDETYKQICAGSRPCSQVRTKTKSQMLRDQKVRVKQQFIKGQGRERFKLNRFRGERVVDSNLDRGRR